MSSTRTNTVGIASAIIIAATLSGCGGPTSDTGANPVTLAGNTSNCQKLPQPTIKIDTPTIAILGTAGPRLASYDQDTGLILNAARKSKARVIVSGVSGGVGAPSLLSNVVLEGEGNNNLARTNDINCKTAKVAESIDELKKGESAKAPNVFDAINVLAGNLSHNPSRQPVDVALLTSLVARGGGVDLSDPATLADPVAAINSLAAKGLIPSCKNWRIYGVAPAAGLSDVMAAQLKEFWIRYAKRCGGTLVGWENHLAAFPASSAVPIADTSQIRVEKTKSEVTATLGADVLFVADSPTLLDSADPALGELLELTDKYPGNIVIRGYINPIGSSETNAGRALSLQRAATVKAWLVAHHVDAGRIGIVGMGSKDPVYANPKTEAESAANRRVVAVIGTEA